jgi:hypothetical protein
MTFRSALCCLAVAVVADLLSGFHPSTHGRPFAAAASDWPQLARDAARTGATATELRPPFARKWYRLFAEEGIQAGVQPVVAGGRVYLPTLRGRLHAIDAETGKDAWVYAGDGTERGVALHAAAVAGDKVFVALGDSLHAVNVADGTKAWAFRTPVTIWNAPAVHEGVVYFGGRDGQVHALDAATGRAKWSAKAGGAVVQSPAVDARNGRVVVGTEDMHAYAFELATGREVWRSPKLPGVSFRGYHPVVAPDGSVIVTVTPAAGGDAMQDVLLDMTKEVFGRFASWRIKDKAEKERVRADNFELMRRPETYTKQLDYLRKRLTDEPAMQTFFVLDGATGRQKFVAPIVYAESMNGPASPPVVTPEGKVIVKYSFLSRSRYEHYSPFLNVGYLDTATGHVAPLMDESRTYGWHDGLLLVHDEQSQLMVAGGILVNTHQDNVNALDLATRQGQARPWAVNVHEVEPGVGTSLALKLLRGREFPQGWEWLPRGTAVYGGGSAIDVPVVAAGDSFYFLPTHELSAGVALVAYRMDAGGRSHERAAKPADVLAEKMEPDDWKPVMQAKWDWDTLEAERLKGTLAGLGDKVDGTRQRPMTDVGEGDAGRVTDAQLDAIILGPEGRVGADESKVESSGGAAAARSDLPLSTFDLQLRAKLAAAVEELISQDWRPLLFPAAKHPAEAYRLFLDPTETLYTFALAYPHLPPELQAKVRARVATMRAPGGPLHPPMGKETYDLTAGAVRSFYDEPPPRLVRVAKDVVRYKTARLYPLWLWAHVTGDFAKVKADWPALRDAFDGERSRPLPDLGNDRLSSYIAFVRLAKRFGDEEGAQLMLRAARLNLRERIAYEVAHDEGGLITTHGTRSLLGRWHHVDPDLGRFLATFARKQTTRLMDVYVDHHRPAWHVAWNVELLWRNEAPFSFPDLSRDVFAAKAMILGERAETLAKYVDVPWCRADEYFVQKLAMLCAAMQK